MLHVEAIYNYLQHKVPGQRVPKQPYGLARVCEEVLGILLSKELQCGDWSKRPLTEEQNIYAAADAHCLVEIFNVFQAKIVKEVWGEVPNSLKLQMWPAQLCQNCVAA
ncbi:uncharacterized protein [Primulina eburnea]|uniref:uncharacterized protein n=1 Tax=Primulina eburnea TaxID=1245227 RepID=UPI003C6C8BC3